MKRKRKENQIIEVLNQVMGKGGICIHYTLPVVSDGVTAGRDLDRLVYHFFKIPFSVLSFCVWGVCWERGLGCLSPHFSVPPGIPYCHSTPRPLTGAQIRDQGISDCMFSVSVCVCVTRLQNVCVSLKR